MFVQIIDDSFKTKSMKLMFILISSSSVLRTFKMAIMSCKFYVSHQIWCSKIGPIDLSRSKMAVVASLDLSINSVQ